MLLAVQTAKESDWVIIYWAGGRLHLTVQPSSCVLWQLALNPTANWLCSLLVELTSPPVLACWCLLASPNLEWRIIPSRTSGQIVEICQFAMMQIWFCVAESSTSLHCLHVRRERKKNSDRFSSVWWSTSISFHSVRRNNNNNSSSSQSYKIHIVLFKLILIEYNNKKAGLHYSLF